MLPNEIKYLLNQYGLRPSKSKGQNFLINANVLQKIIKAADLSQNDYVLEIGPGLGVLTEELIKRSKKVLSIELDKGLVYFLRQKFRGVKNLEILEADILQIRNEEIVKLLNCYNFGYKVVANLPYNITKPVLQKFLKHEPKPEEMTVLTQKEVAQKITAKPGEMNILGISVQFYSRPQIIGYVAKDDFYPVPQVESAILKIKLRPEKIPRELSAILPKSGFEEKKIWQLIKIGFSSPRKQLQNNLAAGFKLSKEEVKKKLKLANLQAEIRPQNLSLADWARLYLEFMA